MSLGSSRWRGMGSGSGFCGGVSCRGRGFAMHVNDNRVKPSLECVDVGPERKRMRDADKPDEDREGRKHYERQRHAARRFVRLEVTVSDAVRVHSIRSIVRAYMLARLMMRAVACRRDRRVVRLEF